MRQSLLKFVRKLANINQYCSHSEQDPVLAILNSHISLEPKAQNYEVAKHKLGDTPCVLQ